jgi:hypothetical protein
MELEPLDFIAALEEADTPDAVRALVVAQTSADHGHLAGRVAEYARTWDSALIRWAYEGGVDTFQLADNVHISMPLLGELADLAVDDACYPDEGAPAHRAIILLRRLAPRGVLPPDGPAAGRLWRALERPGSEAIGFALYRQRIVEVLGEIPTLGTKHLTRLIAGADGHDGTLEELLAHRNLTHPQIRRILMGVRLEHTTMSVLLDRSDVRRLDRLQRTVVAMTAHRFGVMIWEKIYHGLHPRPYVSLLEAVARGERPAFALRMLSEASPKQRAAITPDAWAVLCQSPVQGVREAALLGLGSPPPTPTPPRRRPVG